MPEVVAENGASSRGLAVDTALLGASTIATGLMAYVFVVVLTRSVGAEAAAPVVVLWTYWTAATSALTFPVQHWIARTARLDGHERRLAAATRRFWSFVLLISTLAGVGTWLLGDRLFDGEGAFYPTCVGVITLESALMGTTRGTLMSRQRYGATAMSFVGETALRVVAALLCASADLDARWYAFSLLLGVAVVVAWPDSLRFSSAGHDVEATPAPLQELADFAGSHLVSQVVLAGPPIALALLGGSKVEITSLFAAFTVLRLPHLMARRLVTTLTVELTRWYAAGQSGPLFAAWVWTVVGSIVAAAAGAIAAWLAGPWVVRLLYGPEIQIDGASMAAATAGAVLGLGNLVLNLFFLVRGRDRMALLTWLSAFAAGVLCLAVTPGEAVRRVIVGFLVVEAGVFVALAGQERRLAARGGAASA